MDTVRNSTLGNGYSQSKGPKGQIMSGSFKEQQRPIGLEESEVWEE